MPTESQSPPRSPGRTRRVLLVGIVVAFVVVATSGGIALRRILRPPAPPAPPEAKGDLLEPAVLAAVQASRERVFQEPRSAHAWGDLGEVFLANELDEQSVVCFAEAERLDPRNPRWPYFQAGPLLNQGEREAALPYLLRALEHYEKEGEASTALRMRLAETLLFLGRLDEAEAHLRHALDRQPQDPRALFDLGLLAMSRGDWVTAKSHLLHCLGSPFTQQKARVQLAFVCSRLGDATSADDFQEQASRVSPDRDWVDPFIAEYLRWAVKKKNRIRLAEHLEASGRLPEAIGALRALAADFPDDYLAHLSLGRVLAQVREFRDAEPSLREALRLAPDKVQCHYILSLMLLQKGEAVRGADESGQARAEAIFREAASLARQALAIKPDYGYAHMALGLSLKHLGEKTEALAALRQAVRCNPEYAELHLRLGEMLAEDGQGAEARARFEHALRLAPPGAAWRQGVQARVDELKKGAGPE